MDLVNSFQPDPPSYREYLRLPDTLTTGRYDHHGQEDAAGRVFVTTRGTAFIWCVFDQRLKAGQEGEMVITNMPGTFLVGVSFTEWDSIHEEPMISNALFTLGSAQRGVGDFRIVGRNTHGADLHAAVGIVVADDAAYA